MKTLPNVICALALAALGCSFLSAQDLKLTSQEKKNQAIAYKEFHDMLQYGHLELATKFIAPTYIQHNPNVPSGRNGFVQFMSARLQPESIKPDWKTKPVLTIASGDLVIYMWERTAPDPADPNKTYKYNTYDMVRIDHGMVQEHWDTARKNPPDPPKP